MYKNSKHTVLFPLLLAAGVVLGLVLGQYLGRNTTTSQLKGMLSRMALPDNKLSYTLSLIENQYVDSVSKPSASLPSMVIEYRSHEPKKSPISPLFMRHPQKTTATSIIDMIFFINFTLSSQTNLCMRPTASRRSYRRAIRRGR